MTFQEPCIGCGGLFPVLEGGATHRYMDSSAACWAAFNALPDVLEPTAFSAVLVDIFAIQHPGVLSNQAINSVAIHLMVLYGIFEANFKPEQAMWLRIRPGRFDSTKKHSRFHWLTPPSFANCLTVADVVAGKTSLERSSLVERWAREVWAVWKAAHGSQVAAWFEKFVVSEG